MTMRLEEDRPLQIVLPEGGGTIMIAVAPRSSSSLADLAIYAPALPGVIVAMVALFVAHYLTDRRDRRKEMREFCEKLKDQSQRAADVAAAAWAEPDQKARAALVMETKRRFMVLGAAATHLKHASARRWLNPMCWKAADIDLTREVVQLRRACTSDPFEDSKRTDLKVPPEIVGDLSSLMFQADARFRKRYP